MPLFPWRPCIWAALAGAAAAIRQPALAQLSQVPPPPTVPTTGPDGLPPSFQAEVLPGAAQVMLDMCGFEDFTHRSESPCHFYTFGFALAWTECSYRHFNNMPGFSSCVRSCAMLDGLCARACAQQDPGADPTKEQDCLARCSGVVSCMHQAALQPNKANATDAVGLCLEELHAPPTPAPDAVAALPTAAPVLSTAAPALLLARQGRLAAAAEQPESKDCYCDTSGRVQGISTGQAGCEHHEREAEAKRERYCFVPGGSACNHSRPSAQFPGLYWGYCKPYDPDRVSTTTRPKIKIEGSPFEGLVGCELAWLRQVQLIPEPHLTAPHPNPYQPPSGPGKNALSDLSNQVQLMNRELELFSTTLRPPGLKTIEGQLFGGPEGQLLPLPPVLVSPPVILQVDSETHRVRSQEDA